ncbi:MAG: peptidylprolyl isomerase [Deltaproteobacteria bacterium]|nr:peptidylprolyl isomerase [Deltaproteobacteria bacterium]
MTTPVVTLLVLAIATGTVHARVVEKIAAVVDNNVILASEVEEKATPLMVEVSRMTDSTKRTARAASLRREVLDRLIDDELISQQAADLRLTVSPEQVDASIAEIKRQNNIDDKQLQDALRGQGMSMTNYRADLKKQLLRFRVINIAVGSKINISEEDIRGYYNRHHKAGGANVQVRASHIFLTIPDGADAGVIGERQALGRKLIERATAGEDFAKLAREFSDDAATRAEGGDLGFFGKDMLPKAIEDLVFAMKPGEVRGPVRADRGFHVIKLVDRKTTDAKPLADVEDDIRMQLRQKEMDKQTKSYLAELRKKSLVDIRY